MVNRVKRNFISVIETTGACSMVLPAVALPVKPVASGGCYLLKIQNSSFFHLNDGLLLTILVHIGGLYIFEGSSKHDGLQIWM